ncbi:MAG: glutaredoxin [Solirubrobacterales bacterium]|nr:glutaredoxin [Solirubrobacterales bacterium]
MSDVVVYTTEPCAFCARVKGLLKSRGLEYREVSLANDPQGRIELAERTGMLTFPQVLVGERVVGGFAETCAAVQAGELDELIGERPT